MTDIKYLLNIVNGDTCDASMFVDLVKATVELQESNGTKVGEVIKLTRDGATNIHFFRTKQDAKDWLENPTDENAPIVSIPIVEDNATSSYVVKLETNSSQDLESSNRNLAINIRATSRFYNPIDQSLTDTGEDFVLTVERQMEDDGEWVTVGTIKNFASVNTNSGNYTKVDLSDYLLNGSQYIRFIGTGNVSGMATTYLIFHVNVAEMTAELKINWGTPFVYNPDILSTHNMIIPVRMSGAIHKTIYYEFYNISGNLLNQGSIEVGTAEFTESYYQGLVLKHPKLAGTYKVRVRLKYSNTEIYTDWTEQNFMATVEGDDSLLYCFNNINSFVYNWSTQHFLDYAVYNPQNNSKTSVTFDIKNEDEDITWMSFTNGDVENNNIYEYTTYVNIENSTQDGAVKLFSAKLFISIQNDHVDTIIYSIDNTNNFAPTHGANFILMPASRSNNDKDKEYIHNESTVEGEESKILATWKNVVFENDGWVSDNNVRSLRLFSNSEVNIPFESFTNNTHNYGLTVEFDFKSNNVSDEEEPIIKLGKEINNEFVGIIFYPKKIYVYKTGNNVSWFQNAKWQENVRTFVAVNIVPNMEVNGTSINLVRIFINDVINREFTFSSVDRFWDGVSSGGITIGSPKADVDIYGIRIFKDRLLSSSEVVNDYIASISDVDKKIAIIESNNIVENGLISYKLAKEKYNVLLWKGVYPSKLNQITSTGELDITIQGDKKHSGTITNLQCKGQGTSSKKYLLWNGTFSLTGSSIYTNGFGEEIGNYYQLDDKSPKIKKLVGKINWASSPQAYKMGLCRMYQDLYDYIFDGESGFEPNGITKLAGYKNTKIAVQQEKFLFFVQENENEEPVYYCNMTWGAAKGDPLTFGYDKTHTILKDYLMIEGSDQTPLLTLGQVPWLDGEVHYNEEEEYYTYNNMGSFDVPLGNRDSITKFQDLFNFAFVHSTRLKYYNGRLDNLKTDDTVDKSYQYFIVGQTFDNFNVYRYDWLRSTWVNASVTKTNGELDVMNLNEQLGLSISTNNADFAGILETFKQARIAKFRESIGNYMHVNDCLFTMQFLKFTAASDNRAKNTYLYYDPVDKIIRFAQDDLDSIGPNNNQGQDQKFYWVEEHDFDSRPTFNGYFWAASGNAFYNTIEDAYPKELRNMMNRILSAMASLGVGYGSEGVLGCFDRYFFSIQRYFPAIAYNECARLCYERAKTMYDAGTYTNDTDPITQSLGDQLENLLDWFKHRIVYMASYCEYGAELGGSLEFRQKNTAVYSVVPFMKMYLYRELGGSYSYPIGYSAPKRCEAGEVVNFNTVGGDSIQTITVAAEYLSDLGDLCKIDVTGSVAFSAAKRVTRLKLGDADPNIVLFKPENVSSFPENCLNIELTNCGSQLGAIGSLKALSKLKIFKALGTGITAIEFPQTNNLETIEIPSSVNTLILRNQNNIVNFTFDKTNLRHLTTGGLNIDTKQFIIEWLELLSDDDLTKSTLELDKIHWTNFSGNILYRMAKFETINISGTIELDSESLLPEQKALLMEKFGNIDSPNNPLHVIYSNKLTATINPSYVIGGVESSTLTVTSLNTDAVITINNSNPDLLTISKIRSEIKNNSLYELYDLTANETTLNVTVPITITDGTISLERSIVIRRRVQVSGVDLSTDETTIIKKPIYASSASIYDVYSTALPSDMTEPYTMKWGLEPISSDYGIETVIIDDLEYQQLVSVNTGKIYARIGVLGLQINKLQQQNGVEVLIIESVKNNNPLFKVKCEIYSNDIFKGTDTIDVVNHAFYKEYAIQTFDPEAANYNPFVGIKMYEAGLGGTWEVKENPDGSKGVALPYEEAANQTGVLSFMSLTDESVIDANGNCIESYTDGALNATKHYYAKDFKELQYFTSITGIEHRSSTINNTIPNLYFNTIVCPFQKISINCLCFHNNTETTITFIFPGHAPNLNMTYTAIQFNTNANNIPNPRLIFKINNLYLDEYATITPSNTINYNSTYTSFFGGVYATANRPHLNIEFDGDGYSDPYTFNVPGNLTGTFFKGIKTVNIINIPITFTTSSSAYWQYIKSDVKVYYQGTLAQWSKIKFDGTQSSPAAVSGNLYIDNVKVQGSVTTTPDEDGNQWAAFEGLPITSVTIGAGTTVLKAYAFNNCKNLSNVDLTEGITEIDDYCFQNCSNLIKLLIPEGVLHIRERIIVGCTLLSTFDLPNTLLTISYNPLDTTLINSIILPDSVTSTGRFFNNNYGNVINTLSLGKNLTTWEMGLGGRLNAWKLTKFYYNCINAATTNSLTSVSNLPGNITIYFGNEVQSIPSFSSGFCYTECTAIYSYATTPPQCNTSIFTHTGTNASSKTLYIPAGTEDAYMAVEGWAYLVNTKGFTISATL